MSGGKKKEQTKIPDVKDRRLLLRQRNLSSRDCNIFSSRNNGSWVLQFN